MISKIIMKTNNQMEIIMVCKLIIFLNDYIKMEIKKIKI